MGNCCTSSSRIPLNLDNVNDVRRSFDNLNTANIDELIKAIKTMLSRYTAGKHKKDNPSTSSEPPSNWNSFIKGGGTVLSFIDQQEENFGESVDLLKSDGHVFRVISRILEELGNTHWTLAALSMIGHLLAKIDQMSYNRNNCLQLLQDMVDLVHHIEILKPHVRNEEKLKRALVIIVKGSMLCAKQLNNRKFFRFLTSSLDEQNLEQLRSDINVLYPKLQLTAIISMLQNRRIRLPVRQPDYPDDAVGIAEREKQVNIRLRMDQKSVAFRAVVIYGCGGIGKTYLARAVYSKLDLKRYNHARVYLNIDRHQNHIKKMQEQILIDLFPNYSSGREIKLRDPEEGREELKRAFLKADKPVFLFIDNILRAEDLKNLLPEGLEKLGKRKHIRLLLTARELSTTEMFNPECRRPYLVDHLQNRDANFEEILCKDFDRINGDVDKILKICGGFPLVLKVVGAHLGKQEYRADKCRQILYALQKGDPFKEDDLIEHMVDFVFKRFEESTQEAFLDICCFFNGERREVVEYAVGSTELKALEDAALVTQKLEYDGKVVSVHDVIKAHGRNMARKNRIRGIESFKQAVKEKRLHKLKGIDLYCDNSSYVLEKEHLDSMSKSLRFLSLGTGISIRATSKETFPELRYISSSGLIPCVAFHSGALPNLAVYRGPLPKHDRISKLPQRLRKITLFKCDEKFNGERSNPIKMAKNSKLEELSLMSLSMTTLPMTLDSFHSFSALKTLKLHKWQEMDELARLIGGLGSLTSLILVKCPLKRLTRLPNTLTHLELENCDKLHDCERLVDLKALQFLNLKGCTSLKKLPHNFGELKDLQHLNLRRCSSLKDVPGFEGLVILEYLNVQSCSNLRRKFRKPPKGLRIER